MRRQIDPGLTSLEILGLAVQAERDAARFYSRFASRVRNPLARSKFKALATQEQGHERLLRSEYRRLSGEDDPPAPPGYAPEVELREVDRLELRELLKIAIRMERDSQQLYQQAAQRSPDPAGRSMLEYLVEFERGHQRQLEAELRFLARDPDLYDKDAILIHVGP